ncbi:Nn.00g096220.m01.CDS01 [Neocucurbitaria sp. VM-36]
MSSPSRFSAISFRGSAHPQSEERSPSQKPPLRRSTRSDSSGFLERVLSIRRKSSDQSVFDIRGALGLILLSQPSEPLIDLIFVHGLGGGSTKTWCLHDDPNLFWPKAWLPREPAFRNVRIHSFGYDSDWMGSKGVPNLNIHDFGKSLLESLCNSPTLKSPGSSPIIFVAHSMGGLVIKQAYILARLDPSCAALAKRMEAMVFLGTPHRGSDLASTLNSILRTSAAHNARGYVQNLDPPSEMLAILNDTFRHYAHDLVLYSFWESQQTNLRVRSEVIVSRESAILGYPNEHSAMLNADHRHVCKYESPSDSNYIVVRDALQTIVGSISKRLSSALAQKSWREMQQIDGWLALPGKPDDDLKDVEEVRIEGSCEWFAERNSFQEWVSSEMGDSGRIYWVSARPATGKSILSGYIINALMGLNLDCSFYFFRHGDREKSTVSELLRSLMFQMALTCVDVRQKLLAMVDRGIRFDKEDPKTVWRKIVAPVISRLESCQTQHWILDALDECSDADVLFPMISSLDDSVPIKIVITSRKTPELVQRFSELNRNRHLPIVISEEISFDDTRADIELYLHLNQSKLHVGNEAERALFLQRILEKSEGCFLWVRLVLDELALAWTVSQVEQILEEVPQDMDLLYTRALEIMSRKPNSAKSIARAILMWTVCSVRPLTLPELQTALQIDLGDEIRELEAAIASLCAQLIHVDKKGRVLVVHLTARTFLVQPTLQSEFRIHEKPGHLRLGEICLRYLCSDELKPPRARRTRKRQARESQRSPFIAYACPAFAEHLRHATSHTAALSVLLDNFLQGSVMSWIEFIARSGTLSVLTRTANSIKAYLQRHIQSSSPLGEFVHLVENWVVDLHRIVAKFGVNLLTSPSSIHWLIPPFCPQSSAVASSGRSSAKGIEVLGLMDTGWDDRLSSIDSHDKQVYSVACGESFFAVGHSTGRIALFHNTTCLEWKSLDHRCPVYRLCFDTSGSLLVSSGRRDLKVWDIESGFMLSAFTTQHDILHFAFADKDKNLIVATRGNYMQCWEVQSGKDVGRVDWTKDLPFTDEGQFRRPPLTAAFSPDGSLLALVYRGRPICLYDLEESELHGMIGREDDPSALALGTNTSPASLVFNTNDSNPLLVAAYEDGDLCLFDYDNLELLQNIEADAQIVACSPDGLTLATGNSAGMVQLMEFETLQLLYRVNADDYGIRCLAFSADNLRFLDIRGTQCNVWEPAVLCGLSKRDESSTEAAPFDPVIKGLLEGDLGITRIEIEDSGNFFFVGKSDGSVCVYDTEKGVQRKVLYRHTFQIPITSMVWGNRQNLIVTADGAGRFIVCLLKRDGKAGWTVSAKLFDKHVDSAISDVLLSSSNNLLLITTSDAHIVWDIASRKEVSQQHTAQTSSVSINHTWSEAHRIFMTPNTATVVDWETSGSMYNRSIQMSERVEIGETQRIKNAFAFADNRWFVVELADLYGERSTTQVWIFGIEPPEEDKMTITPLPDFRNVGQEIMHVIGALGSKLIFLSKSRWVSSIDIDQTDYKSYMRHFPIPADWQSQQRVLRMGVTKNAHILFVRTEEVAVIVRGLDFEEEVLLDIA